MNMEELEVIDFSTQLTEQEAILLYGEPPKEEEEGK